MADPDKNEPWFSVRSLFFDKKNKLYEKRTVLLKASNHSEAINLAEKESLEYSKDLAGVEYMGYSDTFHIFGDKVTSGTEIFSLIRKTDMDRDEYLDCFLDSGTQNRTNLKPN